MKNIVAPFIIFISIFLLTGYATPGSTDWGKPNPDAPKEISQMDYMIGKWKLHTYFNTTDISYSESRADMTVRYIMNGHGITMETQYPTPGPDFFNHVVFHYDAKSKRWEGALVNSLGNRKFLNGKMEDGKLVFIMEGELFKGRKGKNRITYKPVSPDHFAFSMDAYSDKTQKWYKETFKFDAYRLEGPGKNPGLKSWAELQKEKKFTRLEEAVKNPEKVLVLDLSNQKITKLSSEIAAMKNLRSFDLNHVPLNTVPDEIGQLTKLQRFIIGNLKSPNLKLKALPDSIKNLIYLEYLNIIGNPNLDFDATIEQLSHCISLNNLAIMNNGFKKLPKGITRLKSLEMLWMGQNPELDLKDTLEKLAQLPLLKKIGFGSNYYKSIPPEISKLKRLDTIWLNKNAFEKYPDLSGLTNLKAATISNCGIKTVPGHLNGLPNLKVLDLSGNPEINRVELFRYLKKLPKLELLALSRMNFKGIPKGLRQLKSLKKLILTGNTFTPEDKKKLSALLPDTEIKF